MVGWCGLVDDFQHSPKLQSQLGTELALTLIYSASYPSTHPQDKYEGATNQFPPENKSCLNQGENLKMSIADLSEFRNYSNDIHKVTEKNTYFI